MGQLPSVLRELNDPDAALHIGGVLSFMNPLCRKLSEDETDLVGWVSSRNWNPNEKFCARCFELYRRGSARRRLRLVEKAKFHLNWRKRI